MIQKDGHQDQLAEVCRRFCEGEGVDGRIFNVKKRCLFIGEHKHWPMTPSQGTGLETDGPVSNGALIYRDRRDFLIRDGDDSKRNREIDAVFSIFGQSVYWSPVKGTDNGNVERHRPVQGLLAGTRSR